LFSCTGTGRVNRGIESFFREAFDNLRTTAGLHLRFLKGAGMRMSVQAGLFREVGYWQEPSAF
jgi:hypothetical protein